MPFQSSTSSDPGKPTDWSLWTPMPTPDQPGSLRQQLEALDAHYQDHLSWIDPAAAWQAAGISAIPHADPAYLETYWFGEGAD